MPPNTLMMKRFLIGLKKNIMIAMVILEVPIGSTRKYVPILI
ncbi:hypothetical protein [uncultured Methanobrevibacter sp.]|nr:hypothetical protein [uncultured Methanobrevibacter sp.]